jgi:hypothetical protein
MTKALPECQVRRVGSQASNVDVSTQFLTARFVSQTDACDILATLAAILDQLKPSALQVVQ